MKRAVISKRIFAATLVAAVALAAGSFAGASHSAPAPTVATALFLCPPAC